MNKLPSLTRVDTLEIPSDFYWRAGLDNNIYWWKKTEYEDASKSLVMNIWSNRETMKKDYPIRSSSALLFVDRKSQLYFGETYAIGGKVDVFDLEGNLQWNWEVPKRIHSFAVTVDKQGALWFVTTEVENNTIYSYDPTNGLLSLPFPGVDTVYGIVIMDYSKIYSIQNPTVGHIVMCSDFSGNVLHKRGKVDLKKYDPDNQEYWPIYYPENIHLDEFSRLWIDEMGRRCLTIVDSSLNIIGRYDHKDFGLQTPIGGYKFGFGAKMLCVIEPKETAEIILHSYIIEEDQS